jgi:hypothetical protein
MSICLSLKNAASVKGFVSRSALIFSRTIVNFNIIIIDMTAKMVVFECNIFSLRCELIRYCHFNCGLIILLDFSDEGWFVYVQ